MGRHGDAERGRGVTQCEQVVYSSGSLGALKALSYRSFVAERVFLVARNYRVHSPSPRPRVPPSPPLRFSVSLPLRVTPAGEP
jgi:hypothetical protein